MIQPCNRQTSFLRKQRQKQMRSDTMMSTEKRKRLTLIETRMSWKREGVLKVAHLSNPDQP